VELIIATSVLAIAAIVVLPQFQRFHARALQAEAKNNLSQIYTLEQSYYQSHKAFVALAAVGAKGGCPQDNALGLRLEACSSGALRYTYDVTATAVGFVATAAAASDTIVSDCAMADIWTIDEEKHLQATTDAVALCR